MNLPHPLTGHHPRSTHHRLVQVGAVACGVVAGLVELLALQRRRLTGRLHRDVQAGRS